MPSFHPLKSTRLTDVYRLLDISQLEQEIACSVDHSTHKKLLLELLAQPKIQLSDKLRLAIIFSLKYESYNNDISELKVKLTELGVTNTELTKFTAILKYAGGYHRASGRCLRTKAIRFSHIM
jgi:vacuolar protein sorting-associated protein 45